MENVIEFLKESVDIVDFLGYNDADRIIEKISNNKELLNKLRKVPDSFWDDVLSNGLIICSNLTYITDSGHDEDVSVGYIDIERGEKHMPSLSYQIKRKIR